MADENDTQTETEAQRAKREAAEAKAAEKAQADAEKHADEDTFLVSRLLEDRGLLDDELEPAPSLAEIAAAMHLADKGDDDTVTRSEAVEAVEAFRGHEVVTETTDTPEEAA